MQANCLRHYYLMRMSRETLRQLRFRACLLYSVMIRHCMMHCRPRCAEREAMTRTTLAWKSARGHGPCSASAASTSSKNVA